MKKFFVLDTNVLLHNADSIVSFADNTVVLPMSVIEELDKFKSHNDELGRNARHVIRQLDSLRTRGRLAEGVPMENGGTLMIFTETGRCVDPGLDMHVPDNRILAVAYTLLKKGEKVIFVSKDINARLKADALGIEVMDFEKQKVNIDELYTGQRELPVPGSVVDAFYRQKGVSLPGLSLMPNEFVLLRDEEDEKHTALGRSGEGERLIPLREEYEKVWNIQARSKEQRMAFELLMDPAVQLVTLVGRAGTGKTLLALAAALEQRRQFHQIYLARPVVPLANRDIGFLPGDIKSKIDPYMEPLWDNLAVIKHRFSPESKEHNKINDMIQNEKLVISALAFIRGRSLSNIFFIVDEAQNLTPLEVKTIITRAGEGAKIVFTGDIYQIDSPYLDSQSNGLTYLVDRMKGQQVFAHVNLLKGERSHLAELASDLL